MAREYINREDLLNTGREKLNRSIDKSYDAEDNSKQAIKDANDLGNKAINDANTLGNKAIKDANNLGNKAISDANKLGEEAKQISSDMGNESLNIARDSEKKATEANAIAKDTNNRMDQIVSGTTNDQEIIDARDSHLTLNNRLKDDKQVIENKIENSKAEINDRLDADLEKVLADSDIDIGGNVKSYFSPAIEELKNKIDKSRFNLLFETDLHYDQGRQNYPLSNLMLPHLNNALSFDGDVDVILFGGDNIDGYQPNKKTNLKHLEQFTTKVLYSAEKSDVFLINGNHDDGSIRTADFGGVMPAGQVISQAEFKQHFMTDQLLNGETRDGDSLYFYKDYPEKKIRLIGLDSVDTPDSLDADGNIKYQKQYWCGYQQKQLEWLANKALDGVPPDYHTLIVTHVHLSLSDKTENGATEYHPNHACLVEIIEAFKSGSNVTLESDLEDYQVNFIVDFTKQGPRTFIGVFNGHVHKNAISTVGTIKNIWFDCSISRVAAEIGTPQEDSFTVISIDNDAKKVELLGFGRSTDRSFNY